MMENKAFDRAFPENLIPGRQIRAALLHTVLTGAAACRFPVTVGEAEGKK